MKNIQISFRVTPEEYKKIKQKQKEYEFNCMAQYVRFTALNAEVKAVVQNGEKGA